MAEARLESRERALAALQEQMHVCRRCADAGFDVQGPALVAGRATAQMMLIGQAPARFAPGQRRQPWSGAGGQRLMAWLADAGFQEADVRQNAYMAALTRCYPGRDPAGHGDRAPSPSEQALCAPYLRGELALVHPRLILLIGKLAIARFLGPGTLSDHVGNVRRAADCAAGPYADVLPADAWLVPLPHPSGASLWLNRPSHRELVGGAMRRLRDICRDLGMVRRTP